MTEQLFTPLLQAGLQLFRGVFSKDPAAEQPNILHAIRQLASDGSQGIDVFLLLSDGQMPKNEPYGSLQWKPRGARTDLSLSISQEDEGVIILSLKGGSSMELISSPCDDQLKEMLKQQEAWPEKPHFPSPR